MSLPLCPFFPLCPFLELSPFSELFPRPCPELSRCPPVSNMCSAPGFWALPLGLNGAFCPSPFLVPREDPDPALQRSMWLEREGIFLIFYHCLPRNPQLLSSSVQVSLFSLPLYHKNPFHPTKFHLLNDFNAGKLDWKGRACSICPPIVRLSGEWLWQS